MKARCSVFIATSLDGFISTSDGGIDWLEEANRVIPPGEDCGFGEFMSRMDALVMGRHTFEKVLSFGEWPYGSMPVTVMSHSLTSLPLSAPATVSLSRAEPAELVSRLADTGAGDLYVDGGLTIQSFLAAGLIGEMTITLIPILLGSGRPLFGHLAQKVYLHLVASKAYDFGLVQNRYLVLPNS